MPARSVAAKSGGELESAQDAEREGAQDVEHHRQGHSVEVCIVRRHPCAFGQAGQADGPCEGRDSGERDQRGRYQPIGSGGGGSPLPGRN
ncbi:hypothetical protein [Dictyobacter formicarum]|uniref:hypothetical protein n=1 Tax=Dictyobacter formicarum TaxID=2778368 RepID=UPI001F365A9F|nr:hypothetical protein [Dictyobacter formicarum]